MPYFTCLRSDKEAWSLTKVVVPISAQSDEIFGVCPTGVLGNHAVWRRPFGGGRARADELRLRTGRELLR